MVYNVYMKRFTTTIIGGGAAGLFAAARLSTSQDVLLLERGERLGKKLSATGNGQGNITNLSLSGDCYFSQTSLCALDLQTLLDSYPASSIREFFASLGVLTIADDRGRVYPASRQASSLTDALRFQLARLGTSVQTGARVTSIEKSGEEFIITAERNGEKEVYRSQNVVVCTGGKAAKNFGTDGSAYALVQVLGHSVTALYPSLVQLKTDTAYIKALKGIRAADIGVTATWTERGEQKTQSLRGDVIFTDYGVSGDAIFRISAYLTHLLEQNGAVLSLDLLPTFTKEEVEHALSEKQKNYPDIPFGELLCGMVNNQIARAVARRVSSQSVEQLATLVKAFSLPVLGSLGFDYAQVTKGGVPLCELDENLQSKKVKGLYLAGEILDIDGACGGYNLHLAFATANLVCDALENKSKK